MLRQNRLFLSFLDRKSIQNLKYSIKIGDKPLGDIFFKPRIQFLMKKLTVVDYSKIFEVRKMGKRLSTPVYTFMTDVELEQERKRIELLAEKLLQMPPLIDTVKDNIEILSNDGSLDGHDPHHSKMIFTDISFDLGYHDRMIVVREPDGILRTANRDERHRMNQIYFPVIGRQIETPKMFEPKHLQEVLNRKDYEFILDRACIQFEPYDEDYHSVLTATFEHINNNFDFEKLIKTRHFGPLALYLAINRKINNMLRFFLERDQLMEASYIVNMYTLVHSEPDPLGFPETQDDENMNALSPEHEAYKSVKAYISDPKNKATKLESVLEVLIQSLRADEDGMNERTSESEVA